jgi:hypothetical protein
MEPCERHQSRAIHVLVACQFIQNGVTTRFVQSSTLSQSRKSTETLVKPLDEAWSTLHDPFFNIRDANDEEFYRLFLPDEPIAKGWPNLFGLNCVINPGAWDERNALADAVTLFDLGAGEEQKS